MSTGPVLPTECVTFPRSGHHLFVRLLKAYFGEETLGHGDPYTYPEQVLGLDPGVRFQHNHDVQLASRIHDDRQYIVQIRYPLDSLTSWFKMKCDKGKIQDTPDAWVNFALQNASLWIQFYRKWVLDYVPNRLIINYADFVNDPEHTITRAVEHLTGQPADPKQVASACATEDIRQRNNYRTFKHFGESFFAMLKGFFASVPGVDLRSDQLVIPDNAHADEPDTDPRLIAVRALRQTAAQMLAVADEMSAGTHFGSIADLGNAQIEHKVHDGRSTTAAGTPASAVG